MKLALPLTVLGLVVCQATALVVCAWNQPYAIDPDTICYVRTAGYYAGGQTDLMVTGWWQPLFSWFMVPLLGLFENPLFVARTAMCLSAPLFVMGATYLLVRLELPRAAVILGSVCSAVAATVWALTPPQPDLLLAAIVAVACGNLLARAWPQSRWTQAAAGAWFGLAYLCKSVALPVFVLAGACVAVAWTIGQPDRWRKFAGSLGVTVLGFAVVAGPWIGVLSWKYGRPTFTNKSKMARSLLGPPEVRADNPSYASFHVPPAGRLTIWEDPSHLPWKGWSPWSSWPYMKHQIRLFYRNANKILEFYGEFDWLRLATFCVIAGLFLHYPWRENLMRDRWRWGGIVVVAICALYTLSHARCERYFWSTYPFLFAATVGLALQLTHAGERKKGLWGQTAVFCVVGFSFLVNFFSPLADAAVNEQPQPPWLVLAEKLQEQEIRGSLADDAGFGLFVGMVLDEPYYGMKPDATPDEFARSGAELILAMRRGDVAAELDRDDRFQSLDETLFDSLEEAEAFDLKMYRNLTAEQPTP